MQILCQCQCEASTKHKQGGEHASRAARHCRKLDLPLPFEPSRPYRRPIVSSMEQSCIGTPPALGTGYTAQLCCSLSHQTPVAHCRKRRHIFGTMLAGSGHSASMQSAAQGCSARLYELHAVKPHAEAVDFDVAAGGPRGQHAGDRPRVGSCHRRRRLFRMAVCRRQRQACQAHLALTQQGHKR